MIRHLIVSSKFYENYVESKFDIKDFQSMQNFKLQTKRKNPAKNRFWNDNIILTIPPI